MNEKVKACFFSAWEIPHESIMIQGSFTVRFFRKRAYSRKIYKVVMKHTQAVEDMYFCLQYSINNSRMLIYNYGLISNKGNAYEKNMVDFGFLCNGAMFHLSYTECILR